MVPKNPKTISQTEERQKFRVKENFDREEVMNTNRYRSYDSEKRNFTKNITFHKGTNNTQRQSGYKDTRNQDFCTYHKITRHKTEDCRAQTFIDKRDNPSTNSSKRNCAVQEPIRKAQTIELDIRVESTDVIGLLNTGLTRNFIIETLVQERKLETNEIFSEELVLADGQNIKTKTECEVTFTIKNELEITYLNFSLFWNILLLN